MEPLQSMTGTTIRDNLGTSASRAGKKNGTGKQNTAQGRKRKQGGTKKEVPHLSRNKKKIVPILSHGTRAGQAGQSRPYSTVQDRTLQDRTLPYRDRTGQHPPYPPQAGGMARVPSRTHRKSDLINSGQFTRKSRARVTHSRSGSG